MTRKVKFVRIKITFKYINLFKPKLTGFAPELLIVQFVSSLETEFIH